MAAAVAEDLIDKNPAVAPELRDIVVADKLQEGPAIAATAIGGSLATVQDGPPVAGSLGKRPTDLVANPVEDMDMGEPAAETFDVQPTVVDPLVRDWLPVAPATVMV